MNTQQKPSPQQNAVQALESPDPSVRLRAALEMGKHPDPEHLDALVGRCAVEPDFYVRDMLTWAITRLPSHSTLPRLRRELGSETAQARSQALHTLSKIGDRSAWPWVSRMLRDPDCEVARTAWRSAAALVPDDARRALAVELAGQLGRGDRSLQRSLSRSLIELGPVLDEVLAPVAGLSVLLVDDVVTTGATLGACARALRQEGASVIGALAVAAAPPPARRTRTVVPGGPVSAPGDQPASVPAEKHHMV